ncbi:hypothetical protein C8F01DRAFT_1113650 [Mycena amicta]|nr:hypothetical protein C8F01DRAFT_1113650 [Mycena amicta]
MMSLHKIACCLELIPPTPMASTNLTIIVDDRDPRIVYSCPSTKQTVKGSYFRDTWTAPDSLSCGLQYGWFTFAFNGTRVRISATDSQVNDQYSVKIDNGSFVGQIGSGFFESPELEDGPHSVTYSSGNTSLFPAFDYLTITAGPSTQLFGETIIVDDAQVANFSGRWSTEPISQSLLSNRPLDIYQNTTHWTNTTGDTFTLDFEGDSIAVYGMIPDTDVAPGNSTIACFVDGVKSQIVTRLPMGTLQPQPMVLLCRVDVPAGGVHTFMLNVTQIAPSHSYGIDFIVYNSSAHTSPPPGAGSAIQEPLQGSSKTHRIRVIVGSTIGAVAALALLLIVLILVVCRRIRTRRSSKWTASKADL